MMEASPNTLSTEIPNLIGFEGYYHEHSWALRAWLSGRVAAADIDDVAQEIWAKVAGGKFPGGNFRAWLFQVARRLIIDRYRSWANQLQRKSVSLSAPNQDGEQSQIDITDLMAPPDEEEETELDQLRSCFDKLDSLKQQIVRGWMDDLKYNVLGNDLQLSETEVSNHFRTAKTQLRRCLERNP